MQNSLINSGCYSPATMEKIAMRDEIREAVKGNKIKSVTIPVGAMGKYFVCKVFEQKSYDGKFYVYVVNRAGIDNFMADAQRACIYGEENVHYKKFTIMRYWQAASYVLELIKEAKAGK